LGHTHILCIAVWENRIICCQIFCDLLLKSAFEWIFNVMQLILVKIKWHIKWKYLIQKFHDICLSYYFKFWVNIHNLSYKIINGKNEWVGKQKSHITLNSISVIKYKSGTILFTLLVKFIQRTSR
jgi:hypothetical protein